MKPVLSLLLAIMCSTPVAAQQCGVRDDNATDIVEKHIAAIGGAAAFDSVQSVTREGTQNYFGIVEALRITYEKDKLLRYDAEYNNQKGYWMVSKTEGGEFFPWEGSKPVVFSRAVLAGMQGNIHQRDLLMHYKEDSAEISLLGKDTIRKNLCYKIKFISRKYNAARTYWIDAGSYMLLRMEKYYVLRNKSNDKLKAVDRTDYLDYRSVGNIKLPFAEKFRTYVNKTVVGEKDSQFYKIQINQPVDASLYHINPGATEVTAIEQ